MSRGGRGGVRAAGDRVRPGCRCGGEVAGDEVVAAVPESVRTVLREHKERQIAERLDDAARREAAAAFGPAVPPRLAVSWVDPTMVSPHAWHTDPSAQRLP